MKLCKKITKKISLLIIISIVSLNFSFFIAPPKAKAQLFDIPLNLQTLAKNIWDVLGPAGEKVITIIVKRAVLELINDITNATIDWIEGNEGTPTFISNFGQYALDLGDRVIGDYIENDPNLEFLCDPFRAQINMALSLNMSGGSNYLFRESNCSLTEVTSNIEDALYNSSINLNANIPGASSMNSFSLEGGWDSWLALSAIPQNNVSGAFILAQEDLNVKIETKKGSVSLDLQNSGGALSFNKCVDIYQTYSGDEVGRSEEYRDSAPRPEVPANYKEMGVRTVQKCTLKTPGRVLSSFLEKSANRDENILEMTAALGDAVDAIISAAANAIFKAVTTKLSEGLFDQDYIDERNSMVGTIAGNATELINITQSNADDTTGFFRSIVPGDMNFGIDMNDFDSNMEALNHNLFDYDPEGDGFTLINPPQTETTGDSTSGENLIIGYSPLAQAQNNALILLNSLSRSEFNYRNNYEIARNILIEAQKVFSTSSACNMSFNSSESVLRAMLIRGNVITNIDGTPNSDRNIANIPWNLQIIQEALLDSNANQVILDEAALSVRSAPSINTVTEAMTPVNSTSFNTDPQKTMIDNIKTWLRGVQAMYNSTICPIDITQVLEINSSTSTIQ